MPVQTKPKSIFPSIFADSGVPELEKLKTAIPRIVPAYFCRKPPVFHRFLVEKSILEGKNPDFHPISSSGGSISTKTALFFDENRVDFCPISIEKLDFRFFERPDRFFQRKHGRAPEQEAPNRNPPKKKIYFLQRVFCPISVTPSAPLTPRPTGRVATTNRPV